MNLKHVCTSSTAVPYRTSTVLEHRKSRSELGGHPGMTSRIPAYILNLVLEYSTGVDNSLEKYGGTKM